MHLSSQTHARLASQVFVKPTKRPVGHHKTTWHDVIMKDIEIYPNFRIKKNNILKTLKHFKLYVTTKIMTTEKLLVV